MRVAGATKALPRSTFNPSPSFQSDLWGIVRQDAAVCSTVYILEPEGGCLFRVEGLGIRGGLSVFHCYDWVSARDLLPYFFVGTAGRIVVSVGRDVPLFLQFYY